MKQKRRDFMKGALAGGAALSLGVAGTAAAGAKRDFKISVAGWSFHHAVDEGMKQTELFAVIREEFDLGAFELVNNMLEVTTASYVDKLAREARKHDVVIPLIMVDSEGSLGHKDADVRRRAVRDHTKWIHVASDLGCHAIRVNWSAGERGIEKDASAMKTVIDRSASSYEQLVELGQKYGIDIIIENHWGPSSYPDVLVALMKKVGSPHFGTLPDFGNFPDEVDRYDAVEKMMPYAKALSAKCYDFGPDGKETTIDFERMMKICHDDHGYHGYIGIEYEGDRLSERDGVRACRDLLLELKG